MAVFIPNKYYHWYTSIIENRKLNPLRCGQHSENHHILPSSMGGSDDPENIVTLTLREHYICHLLLPKCTLGKDRERMIAAFVILSGRKKYRKSCGSRNYQFYRKEYQRANSERVSGVNNPFYGIDRNGINNPFYGKRHTEETKAKISKKKLGISVKLPPQTNTHKANLSQSAKNRHKNMSNQEREMINDKRKTTWSNMPMLTCPNCGKESKNKSNMTRYHFSKCKIINL